MAASVATSSKSISGFDPRSLSGCVLWLDADDPYTLFSDAGGTTIATSTVNAWKDKSTSALLFAGGTSGPTLIKSTTVNSRPYLSFNGTSNYLLNTSMSVSQPYTIYVVGYATASAASTYYRILHGLSAGSVNFNLVIGALAGNVAMFIGNASSWNDVNAIVPATTSINVWVIYSATVTGGTLNSFLNGTACTSKTGNIASTISGFNIGGGQSSTGYSTTQPFQGYVGEILMYNYILSASQRQQVEGYLAWKWGMTSSSITKPTVITLPVSHSFYITKPHSRRFSPLDIPGCALWLDAADKSTFTLTSGNITTWTDKSSTANNFTTTAGTATNITDGGYSVVSFPSGTIMTSTSTLTWTTSSAFFVVSKIISIPSGQYADYIIGFSSIINADFSIRVEPLGLCGTPAPTIPPNVNDLSIYNYYVNGSLNPNFPLSTYQSYNIIHTGNPSQAGTSVMTLSTIQGRYLVGNIAEVLYYPGGVTSIQRQQIESYLAWKWGITLATTSQPTFVTTFAYNGTTQINGTVQSWLCPTGVTSVTVYIWGAGGGGAYPNNGVSGGAGAFVTGTWTTTPGTTYYITVGAGGIAATGTNTGVAGGWPGGGSSGTYGSAGGGGYSGIFTTSATPSQANAVVIAGGGGGAGVDEGADWGGSASFKGTSQTGGYNGNGANAGGGATTTAGGTGGTGSGYTNGTAGSALTGGTGGGYGAGGGGGYWGGGGGSYYSGVGGGGGGSSYSGGLTNPTGITSLNATGNTAITAPGSSYQYYINGVAASSAGQNGGNGLVVIVSASNQYNLYPPLSSLPFYPTHISGCLLWLDGNDPAGTGTKPTAGTLATWVDKSGSGYNATAAVAATYVPLTGALNFTGTQSYTTTLPSYLISQSGFAVVTFSGATKMDIIALTQTVGAKGGLQQIIQNSQQIITTYDGTIIAQATTTLAENKILLYNYTFDISKGAYIYYNGTQTVATNPPYLFSNFNATINIGGYNGASEPYIGNMYEIILYNTALSTSQRQQIEGYLAAKWGFLLPSNHSYYKFAPSQLAPPVSTTFSSSFTPGGVISGVKVWLDASDPTTLYSDQGTTAATIGGTVAYWRDKSGSANHYTQTTAANQPIYSNLGGVLFPATNVAAVLINSTVWAGTSSYDVFCVSKPHSSTATGNWRTLLRGSGNDHPVLIESGGTRIGAYNNAVGFYPFGSLTMDGSARTLLYVSISATNTYTASINGTIALSAATAALQNNNFASVGNNYAGFQPWGEINELMILPNCTTAQRQTIEGYLAAKWGLQGSIPNVHPYYTYSPTPTITIAGTTLTATWASSPDVSSYTVNLYSQSTVGGALTLVKSTVQTVISFGYFPLTTNLIYTVYVSVVDSAGISSVPAVSNSVPCLSTPSITSLSVSSQSILTVIATAQLGGTISYLISPAVAGVWSNTTGIFTVGTNTTYTITAIVSAKSVSSISATSSVISLASPTFTASISDTTFTANPFSSGATAYSVSLYTSVGTLVTTNTTGVFTGLSAGTAYFVQAYATATNSTSAISQSSTIYCIQAPTATTNNIVGQTYTAVATAQNGATITYAISPSTGTSQTSTGVFSLPTSSTTTATTYTVTVTVTSSGATTKTANFPALTTVTAPTFTAGISDTTFTSTPSSSGATAYSVSLYSGTSGSGILVTTNTTGVFTGLSAGTAYYVTAYATATNVTSATSTSSSIYCITAPTSATNKIDGTTYTAVATAQNGVTFTYSISPSTGVTQSSAGVFTGLTVSSATTYTVTATAASSGATSKAAAFTALTTLTTPTMTLTFNSTTKIVVSWTPNTNAVVTAYYVTSAGVQTSFGSVTSGGVITISTNTAHYFSVVNTSGTVTSVASKTVGCATYDYTGGIQSNLIVFSGTVTAVLYGAGGGGTTYAAGGAGSKVVCNPTYSGSKTIYVIVGGAGNNIVNSSAGGYGGGGRGTGTNGTPSGGGGGRSGISSNNNLTSDDYTAGGGGGGSGIGTGFGGYGTTRFTAGAIGGGSTAATADNFWADLGNFYNIQARGGGGGTQTTGGGAGGSGGNNFGNFSTTNITPGSEGTIGAKWTGGIGANYYGFGGGGGGGYYGGGGGGAAAQNNGNQIGYGGCGGGGGSDYGITAITSTAGGGGGSSTNGTVYISWGT